jgi:hypothetical protein
MGAQTTSHAISLLVGHVVPGHFGNPLARHPLDQACPRLTNTANVRCIMASCCVYTDADGLWVAMN